MATHTNETKERLGFRVSGDLKELIEEAADIQGVTVSDFLKTTAYKEATRTIQDRDVIRLNKEETERFVESFLNPPPPNENLRKLMQGED